MSKLIVAYMEIPSSLTLSDAADHLPLISPERRQAVNKYRNETDKLTSLYAEVILRNEVMLLTGLDNEKIIIKKSKSGKPYLDGLADVHFSISHSDRYLAVAVHDKEIGIDIEVINKARMKVAKRFFMPQEYEFILNADSIDEAFYYIWTRKEAYVKYTGEGLKRELDSFSVLDNEKSTGNFRSFIQGCSMISLYTEDLSESELIFRQS